MSESSQWTTVKQTLSELDPRRVDNSCGPGTPDVNFGGVWNGSRIEGQIELKWLRNWPARSSTVVSIDHFTPQQRIWLKRRWKFGGTALMLIQVSRDWLLFDGVTAARYIGHVDMSEMFRLCLYKSSNGLNKRNFLKCLQAICHRPSDCNSLDSVKAYLCEKLQSSTE